ncbi:unnamed protein product [Owenia fusiformis]|uniref:Uncharacterized protein n=1 Tax=Owenia fusiformis TaxID=6347 RepID=A0A8J1XSN0_OWEFU|nr:unnamed protein product [Owenia fusiformis]
MQMLRALRALICISIFGTTTFAICPTGEGVKLCADILFAFDTSCSVSDETKDGVKSFLDDFVGLFDSVGKPNLPVVNTDDPTFTQFGMLAYDLGARKIFGFGDQPTKDAVQGAIDEFDHAHVDCKTTTQDALIMAREEFFTSGAQDDRTPNILVLLTDGRTQPQKFIDDTELELEKFNMMNNTYLFVTVLPNKNNKTEFADTLEQLEMLAPSNNRFSYLEAESTKALAVEVRARISGFDPCPLCLGDVIIPPPCPREEPLDILLILDHSNSIGPEDLRELRRAMVELVNAFKGVGVGDLVKFSIMTYNFKAEILSYLNSTESSSLNGTLGILEEMSLEQAKDTRTDLTLELANAQIFTEAFGDRPNAANILVLATDGRTMKKKFQNNTLKAAAALKARKAHDSVDIFLLGLPAHRQKNLDVQNTEWNEIPSKPKATHFKEFGNFTEIIPYISQLQLSVCADQTEFERAYRAYADSR